MIGMNIGVDFGSSSTIMVVDGKGIVLDEPTVIAVDSETKYPIAFGNNAYTIEGRTDDNIEVIHPVVNGVISNYTMSQKLLGHYLLKICGNRVLKPNVIIAVPSACTNLDKRTFIDIVTSAGAGRVCFVEESLASAIGIGFQKDALSGRLLVNMGGGEVDVSVVTMGSIAVADTVKVGGLSIDAAIQKHLKKTRDITVGPLTAERIKICLGSAIPREEELAMIVSGKSETDNMPISFEVTSEEIYPCVREQVDLIMNGIRNVLEKTPPELVGDISDNGIVLTGGTALLNGMDKLVSTVTGIETVVAKDPLYSTASGAMDIVKNIDKLSSAYQFHTVHQID